MSRAITVGLVLVALTLAVLLGGKITSPAGGRVLHAQFTSVRGLVEGGDVRYHGAEAGSVEALDVRDDGLVDVAFRLDDGVPGPRTDASATIRPVDLFGDVYLSYDPGDAAAALDGPISAARTANVSRVEDLLRVFRRPVAQGLEELLTTGGMALERRGADLNTAIVETRPAFIEAARVADELSADNRALAALVADAERATGTLAKRRGALQAGISGIAATTAAAAERRPALAATLDRLPATLDRLEAVGRALDRATRAAIPLSQQLGAAAAPLARTTERLPRFLTDVRATAQDLAPTLDETRRLLRAGRTSLPRLAAGLRAFGATSSELAGLTGVIERAAPPLAQGLFEQVAGQASEPGRQPLDPTTDRRRRYWRGAAVLSCETFGLKVQPGCLSRALTRMVPSLRRSAPRRQPEHERRPRPADTAPATRPAPATTIPPVREPLKPVTEVVDQVGKQTEPVLNLVPDLEPLLDFLLRP